MNEKLVNKELSRLDTELSELCKGQKHPLPFIKATATYLINGLDKGIEISPAEAFSFAKYDLLNKKRQYFWTRYFKVIYWTLYAFIKTGKKPTFEGIKRLNSRLKLK